ncbi:MAG TPA: hypothetical protein VI168_13320 [Croceibacterium sp.]
MAAGYSGTPLGKKLGLKPGQTAWFAGMPESVRDEIAEAGVTQLERPAAGLDVAHVFVTERAELARLLAELRALVSPTGMVWVSWPKKASKVPTDVTEDTIREVALPLGWVDVKVCAVDAVWSGLKLMIRRELR